MGRKTSFRGDHNLRIAVETGFAGSTSRQKSFGFLWRAAESRQSRDFGALIAVELARQQLGAGSACIKRHVRYLSFRLPLAATFL